MHVQILLYVATSEENPYIILLHINAENVTWK